MIKLKTTLQKAPLLLIKLTADKFKNLLNKNMGNFKMDFI